MRFLPAREKAQTTMKAAADLPLYGGMRFRNEGFQFYKHPPASAYNLNRLLFDVRHDSGLRRRLLTDLDGVAAEYSLGSEGKEGARALAEVGETPKISDNASRIVNAGAHPLQALMTLHAVHGEMKKLRSELSNE
jgi:hypothetical protein